MNARQDGPGARTDAGGALPPAIRTRFGALLVLGALSLFPGFAAARHVAAGHRAPAAARAPKPRRATARIEPRPKAKAVRLAITVDDLPGGGPEYGDFTHAKIVADIVAALRKHGITHATGFVVGSMLDGHPERMPALDSWVEAGFDVGNHTFTHSALSEVGLDAYLHDIEDNQPVMTALERRTHQHEHYFRTPYLDEGDTQNERHGLSRYLAAHDYRIARVSVDFSDWAWADAYLRCLEKHDDHALEELDKSYLENGAANLAWSIAAARDVLGHGEPQVLLLHANVATARNLDALLTKYEQQGARFISLQEALNQTFYTRSYDSSGGNVLVQASHKLHRTHPPWMAGPVELLELVCR